MTKEISLSLLLKVLKNAWWKMLVIAVAVAAAVAAFTEFVIPKKYESSVEFYVLNTSTTSEYISTSMLASAEYLSNDYIKIINSDQVVNIIIQKLADAGYDTANITPKKIRSYLSSSIATGSSTFSLTVTTTNKDVSYIIAKAIRDEAPAVMREVTRPSYASNYYKRVVGPDGNVTFEKIDVSDLECVIPVREPQVAKSHSSPNVVTYTLIAAFLAACAVYALCLLRRVSDTIIRSESNIKEFIDPSITIIGTIPYWSTHANEKNS